MTKRYKVRSKVVLWPGEQGAWHFAYVDKKQSALIRERYKGPRRGFGGIRVAVTLGKTKWETSIFPDSKRGAYLLPVKADVRKKEKFAAGDKVTVKLKINV